MIVSLATMRLSFGGGQPNDVEGISNSNLVGLGVMGDGSLVRGGEGLLPFLLLLFFSIFFLLTCDSPLQAFGAWVFIKTKIGMIGFDVTQSKTTNHTFPFFSTSHTGFIFSTVSTILIFNALEYG